MRRIELTEAALADLRAKVREVVSNPNYKDHVCDEYQSCGACVVEDLRASMDGM